MPLIYIYLAIGLITLVVYLVIDYRVWKKGLSMPTTPSVGHLLIMLVYVLAWPVVVWYIFPHRS
jgi:hypothetical protein